jgi:hypothetical protein
LWRNGYAYHCARAATYRRCCPTYCDAPACSTGIPDACATHSRAADTHATCCANACADADDSTACFDDR